jgi:hypothetical protein
MKPGRPGFGRSQRRGDAEPTVVVPVPIDPDTVTDLGGDCRGKSHHRPRASRSGVADRIGNAQPRRPGANRGREQRPQRRRIGAGRVLGDIQHRQAFSDCETDRVLGHALQVVERPPLGVLTDRARSDEGAALHLDARALGDLDDRHDVGDHRPGGAVRTDVQAEFGDREGQGMGIGRDPCPCARQPDVGGLDPERLHFFQDVDLLIDVGRTHRG